jgi:hypothetical protein
MPATFSFQLSLDLQRQLRQYWVRSRLDRSEVVELRARLRQVSTESRELMDRIESQLARWP